MTRLGAYSIVRGAVDRDSFRLTRETLTKGEQKLVIFGEGEISHQNETIMPFESGIAQFGFWALNDMEKAGNVKPVLSCTCRAKVHLQERYVASN